MNDDAKARDHKHEKNSSGEPICCPPDNATPGPEAPIKSVDLHLWSDPVWEKARKALAR